MAQLKSFSPKQNQKGGEVSEVTYNHPDKNKPVTIKSWPHQAADAYEENLLERLDYLKEESKSKGAGPDSGKDSKEGS